jgi:hypothetical protein
MPEPVVIPLVAQSLIFWGLVFAVLILIFLRLRRKMVGRSTIIGEDPESLLKRGEAAGLLKKAIRDAFGEWTSRLHPAQKKLIAARIRLIYAQLMDLCADLGHPRPLGRTPLEFQSEMGELFSNYPNDLDRITQAYIRVRYGEIPESEDEIQAVEDSWKRVAEEGLRLKKTGQLKLQTAEYKEVQRTGV